MQEKLNALVEDMAVKLDDMDIEVLYSPSPVGTLFKFQKDGKTEIGYVSGIDFEGAKKACDEILDRVPKALLNQ